MIAIPLDPATPEEASAFSRDASWARVAGYAIKRGYSSKDWRVAMRAFRVYLDGVVAGQPKGGKKGLTPLEVEQWFDAWYVMLALRRYIGLQDYLHGGEES